MVFRRILNRMENKQTKGGKKLVGDQPKADSTKLPRMEMYAVLGLEMSQIILEKVQSIEESVNILAAQKARELNPDNATKTPPK